MYDMTGTSAPPPGIGINQPRGRGAPGSEGTVELALDPSELDLVDTDAMAARYEQQLREQQSHLQKEDLSDMLADHVARQKVPKIALDNAFKLQLSFFVLKVAEKTFKTDNESAV